jgi:hypothetical protein
MDGKETQREKRNRVKREKRLQEKKEREERAALEEQKRLKRNLASRKRMAKSRARAKMKASQSTSNDEGKKRMIEEEDGSAKHHKTDSIEEVCRSRMILHVILFSPDSSFSYHYRRRNVVTILSRSASIRTCKSSAMTCSRAFKTT